MEIKNITIIGTGTLGLRIGLQSAISGYKVTCYDLTEEILARSRKVIDKILLQQLKLKFLDEAGKASALSKLSYTTDLQEALSDCDLVSESVTEDLTLKEKV